MIIIATFIQNIFKADPITYNIIEDPAFKFYHIQAKVGSNGEHVELLMDSMANGTAINYNIVTSKSGVQH